MKKKNLIIMIEFPLLERDFKRFGINILSKKFNLTILDFTYLINKRILKIDLNNKFNNFEKNNIKYHKITSLFVMKEKIKNLLSTKSIDYLSEGWVQNLIRHFMSFYNIKLIITTHGHQPMWTYTGNKYLQIFVLRNYLAFFRKIIYLITKYNKFYLSIISCLEAKNDYKSLHTLYSHTFDYDIYLKELIKNNSNKNNNIKKNLNIVFLDMNLPNNPDFSYNQRKTVKESTYYNEISKFLRNLQLKKNNIKIALHPKNIDSKVDKYFKNFDVISNETNNTIKDCDLVINHYSTAINFAYLHKKPVLFIITDEMKEVNFFRHVISKYANVHGTSILNISDSLDFDLNEALEINEQKYEDYINKYIKCPNTPHNNSWEIFTKFIYENNL